MLVSEYRLLTPERSDNSYNFYNSKEVKLAKVDVLLLHVTCQLVNVEGVDVVAVLCHFAFGVVDEDGERLRKELGSALGVLQEEVAHDDVGGHLVEFACAEVEEVLIGRCLGLVDAEGELVGHVLNAGGVALIACADGLCLEVLDDTSIEAGGDVADGCNGLELSGAFVDGHDAGITIDALALVLEHEA